MSKNNSFGKFIVFCAAVGAAAAGAYYYLSKKDKELADNLDDDDYEDFDDFEEDDDYSSEIKFGRKYVDISSADESKETIEKDNEELDEADPDENKQPDSSEEFFNDEK